MNKPKSQSQRLRAVIFKLWEQSGSTEDFDFYYMKVMTKVINQMKGRLK